jgi:hypothetical protein
MILISGNYNLENAQLLKIKLSVYEKAFNTNNRRDVKKY